MFNDPFKMMWKNKLKSLKNSLPKELQNKTKLTKEYFDQRCADILLNQNWDMFSVNILMSTH